MLDASRKEGSGPRVVATACFAWDASDDVREGERGEVIPQLHSLGKIEMWISAAEAFGQAGV